MLRDAWIAAEFAKIRIASKVRLVAERWPDFELEIRGNVEAFEAVEALNPERRRGDEYRDGTIESLKDSPEDWAANSGEAPRWIRAACQKKANKRYASGASLVIYLNPGREFGIRQHEVESCFHTATAAAKNNFDSVWILWKNLAHLVWNDGIVSTEKLTSLPAGGSNAPPAGSQ